MSFNNASSNGVSSNNPSSKSTAANRAASSKSRDFGFGEDEAELRNVAGRFLDDQLPVTVLRELVASDPDAVYERGEETGWDPDLWARIVEMGWPALAVPESAGGYPISTAGLVGVVEEAGLHALPSPLLSTISAALVLSRCDQAAALPWLGAIASGSAATLATTDVSGSWRHEDCSVEAVIEGESEGEGLRLSGTVSFVQDAAKSELFVVLCRVGGGHRLVVVRADADGLTIERDHIHDLTRDQASLRFDSVVVDRGAIVSEQGVAALEQAWPGVLVMAAADLCGVAEWLLQTTVEYAKDRVQFDRPIGFFQAVKHPMVNVMIDIDRARSLVYHAASQVGDDSEDVLKAAQMAKSAASDAAAFAADRAVQLHGGIGFTWEHDIHIYFKRAMHGQAIYGDGRYQRQCLADIMLGPIPNDMTGVS